VTRRILALAAFASLLPFPAVADELGAAEDIVVEPERRAPEREVVRETVVREEKPVALPPPGWRAPKPSDESRDR
jgi:hypothetical protein